MRRQFLLLLALTLASQLLETALEIGIPASVALHTEPGCFLYQQFGLSGTHVEDTITAVIGLLLVLVGKKYRVNHLCGIRAISGCPAAVVITVLLIYIPVEAVFLGHMLRFGNVFREGSIRPSVGADQLVILSQIRISAIVAFKNAGWPYME